MKSMRLRAKAINASVLFSFSALAGVVNAQLASEAIDLHPGWNAVWLNLDPEPNSLDSILASQTPPLDFQTIWTFHSGGSPLSPTPGAVGNWFFRDRNVPANVNTLSVLQGNHGYLIKMNSPGRLVVNGRTLIRPQQYFGRVGNLVGAMSNPQSLVPLTFEHFFSHPTARGKIRISGSPPAPELFAMVADTFVRIPMGHAIEANVAYWVNAGQDFEYSGPIDVKSTVNGVDFGKTTSRRTLVVEVPAAEGLRKLTVRADACVALGNGSCIPAPAGAEWLEFRDPGLIGKPAWQPLTKGVQITIPEGQSKFELDLRARRSNPTRTLREDGTEEMSAFFEIIDDRGARTLLSAGAEVQPIFGSWVGRVVLDKVGTHPAVQSLPLSQATASPFHMTLILDLPSSGRRSEGANSRLLETLTLTSHRDGRPILQRFNSVLFDRPVDLNEDAGDPLDPFGDGGTLHGVIEVGRNDALNPYRHRYNPEHRVGYEIIREITLEIERQEDSLLDELAGLDGTFGSNLLTGTYTETITGVSRDPITVEGTFRLNRLVGEIGGLP